jgi:hypothetical protein
MGSDFPTLHVKYNNHVPLVPLVGGTLDAMLTGIFGVDRQAPVTKIGYKTGRIDRRVDAPRIRCMPRAAPPRSVHLYTPPTFP